MFTHRRRWFAAAVAGWFALTLGCSSATAPTGPPADTTPGDASAAARTRALHRLLPGHGVRMTSVEAGIGETLANGRWSIVIPDGAIDGDATVAIALPRTSSTTCQLEILPADQNQFDVPVTLIADCQDVPDAELANYVIYWSDPDLRAWVEVQDSKVHLPTKTVSAPLKHFSRYAVGPAGGKAGW